MKNTTTVPTSVIGQEVNKRLILSEGWTNEKVPTRGFYWQCVLCGYRSKKAIRLRDIAGKTANCCRQRAGMTNPNWRGFNEIPLSYINQVYNGAEKRGIVVEISPQDMWDQWLVQEGRCALSNRPLVFRSRKGTASLDRIDSGRGYVIGNIQWLHKDVNLAKQSMEQRDFIRLCQDVAAMQ